MQQILPANVEEGDAVLSSTGSPLLGHDFSVISIHPPQSKIIQTKLTMNEPGDAYEQEAESVSEQVMQMPRPQIERASTSVENCTNGQTVQPAREYRQLQLKRFGSNNSGQATIPTSVHEVLRSPGRPLDPATRSFMEPRFGYDFSHVRVHTSTTAEQSARDVNALAYTVGRKMVFGEGRFAPGTQEGRRLLAHELTHVAQQSTADGMKLGGNRTAVGSHPPALNSSSLRLARAPDPAREIEREQQEQKALKDVAEDFLEDLGHGARKGHGPGRGSGRRTVGQLIDRLREIERRGGPDAEKAGDLANELVKSRKKIGDLHRARGTTGVPGKKNTYTGVKIEETAAGRTTRAEGAAATTAVNTVRFQSPSLTKPPAKIESGEITVPQRGSVTSGGTTRNVTSVAGEIDVSNKIPVSSSGGFGSAKAAIGFGLVEFAILQLLNLIIGPILEDQFKQQVSFAWMRLLPKVQEDLNRRQGDIKELLRKTSMKNTIYANVSVDMIVIQACYEGGCTNGFYGLEYVPPVGISTDHIDRRGTFSSIDPAPYGNIIHYPVTFSFPIAEPSALLLKDIGNVHFMLDRIKTKLKAVSGGTAGEAVALDYLNVALRATDTKGRNNFRHKTGAERYHATISAIDSCLSFLKDRSEKDPTVQEPMDLLSKMRTLIIYALAERWPIMVE
jgi:Domain of unknown function (DUF4157)